MRTKLATLAQMLHARLDDEPSASLSASGPGLAPIHLERAPEGDKGWIWRQGNVQTHFSLAQLASALDSWVEAGYTQVQMTGLVETLRAEISPKGIKIRYERPQPPPPGQPTGPPLSPDRGAEVLQAIGLLTERGTIRAEQRHKYRQITQFIKRMQPALASFQERGRVSVLDCASGKSYLTFGLTYYCTQVLGLRADLTGLETNPQLVADCRAIQARLDYPNMRFHLTPIVDFQPADPVDVTISLHACDTATDQAIAKGIELESSWLFIVPCCQADVARQLDEHPHSFLTRRHGLFERRLADWLTDGLRVLALEASGYRVSAVEFVSPLDTPKNLMLIAEKGVGSQRRRQAQAEYQKLRDQYGVVPALERLLRW